MSKKKIAKVLLDQFKLIQELSNEQKSQIQRKYERDLDLFTKDLIYYAVSKSSIASVIDALKTHEKINTVQLLQDSIATNQSPRVIYSLKNADTTSNLRLMQMFSLDTFPVKINFFGKPIHIEYTSSILGGHNSKTYNSYLNIKKRNSTKYNHEGLVFMLATGEGFPQGKGLISQEFYKKCNEIQGKYTSQKPLEYSYKKRFEMLETDGVLDMDKCIENKREIIDIYNTLVRIANRQDPFIFEPTTFTDVSTDENLKEFFKNSFWAWKFLEHLKMINFGYKKFDGRLKTFQDYIDFTEYYNNVINFLRYFFLGSSKIFKLGNLNLPYKEKILEEDIPLEELLQYRDDVEYFFKTLLSSIYYKLNEVNVLRKTGTNFKKMMREFNNFVKEVDREFLIKREIKIFPLEDHTKDELLEFFTHEILYPLSWFRFNINREDLLSHAELIIRQTAGLKDKKFEYAICVIEGNSMSIQGNGHYVTCVKVSYEDGIAYTKNTKTFETSRYPKKKHWRLKSNTNDFIFIYNQALVDAINTWGGKDDTFQVENFIEEIIVEQFYSLKKKSQIKSLSNKDFTINKRLPNTYNLYKLDPNETPVPMKEFDITQENINEMDLAFAKSKSGISRILKYSYDEKELFERIAPLYKRYEQDGRGKEILTKTLTQHIDHTTERKKQQLEDKKKITKEFQVIIEELQEEGSDSGLEKLIDNNTNLQVEIFRLEDDIEKDKVRRQNVAQNIEEEFQTAQKVNEEAEELKNMNFMILPLEDQLITSIIHIFTYLDLVFKPGDRTSEGFQKSLEAKKRIDMFNFEQKIQMAFGRSPQKMIPFKDVKEFEIVESLLTNPKVDDNLLLRRMLSDYTQPIMETKEINKLPYIEIKEYESYSDFVSIINEKVKEQKIFLNGPYFFVIFEGNNPDSGKNYKVKADLKENFENIGGVELVGFIHQDKDAYILTMSHNIIIGKDNVNVEEKGVDHRVWILAYKVTNPITKVPPDDEKINLNDLISKFIEDGMWKDNEEILFYNNLVKIILKRVKKNKSYSRKYFKLALDAMTFHGEQQKNKNVLKARDYVSKLIAGEAYELHPCFLATLNKEMKQGYRGFLNTIYRKKLDNNKKINNHFKRKFGTFERMKLAVYNKKKSLMKVTNRLFLAFNLFNVFCSIVNPTFDKKNYRKNFDYELQELKEEFEENLKGSGGKGKMYDKYEYQVRKIKEMINRLKSDQLQCGNKSYLEDYYNERAIRVEELREGFSKERNEKFEIILNAFEKRANTSQKIKEYRNLKKKVLQIWHIEERLRKTEDKTEMLRLIIELRKIRGFRNQKIIFEFVELAKKFMTQENYQKVISMLREFYDNEMGFFDQENLNYDISSIAREVITKALTNKGKKINEIVLFAINANCIHLGEIRSPKLHKPFERYMFDLDLPEVEDEKLVRVLIEKEVRELDQSKQKEEVLFVPESMEEPEEKVLFVPEEDEPKDWIDDKQKFKWPQ